MPGCSIPNECWISWIRILYGVYALVSFTNPLENDSLLNRSAKKISPACGDAPGGSPDAPPPITPSKLE